MTTEMGLPVRVDAIRGDVPPNIYSSADPNFMALTTAVRSEDACSTQQESESCNGHDGCRRPAEDLG